MTLSAIIASYGAYYLGSGAAAQANRTRLFNKIYQPSVTAGYFMLEPTTATVWRATKSVLQRVLQPWQKDWTPLSGPEFTPYEFPLFKMKIDMEELPDDLEGTYVGFLSRLAQETNQSIENLMRTSWPFVRWFIEEHILGKNTEEMEMNEIFWGIFAAPTPGTPGAIGTTMNGLNKTIADNLTSGASHLQATGALATATPSLFVEQIEDWVENVLNSPNFKKVRTKPMTIFMRTYNADRYARGYRDLYGKDTDQTKLDRTVVDGRPNIRVIGLPSMDVQPVTGKGSQKIWMTFSENMIRPTIFAKNQNQVQTKLGNNPRAVQFWSDWWTAANFILPEYVAANELTVTA